MKTKLMIFFILGMMLISCNPLTIKSDFDPDGNFAAYKTYHWTKMKSNNIKTKIANMTPFLRNRIRLMVEETLSKKGLTSVENKKDADLLLALYFNSKKKMNVSHVSVGYGYGPWYYGGPVVSEYKEGTMVIDFVDAKKRELVWRGVASGIAHKDDYSEEDVKYIVNRILNQYPPDGHK
jgi:hypothetical protein